MKISRGILSCGAAALGLCTLGSTSSAQAAAIYGVNFGNLVSFDSADPATTLSSVFLQGLNEGSEFYSILEIDFRPSTGVLYGLGNSPGSLYQLFTIDLASGTATKVGASFGQSSSAFSFGFAFDPVSDTIRLVNNAQQNGILDPATGAYTAQTNLTLGATVPNVASASYTNNYPGATSTTLYDLSLDTNLGYTIAYVQNPPASGQLIFSSGVLLENVAPVSEIGLALSPSNAAFVSTPTYADGAFSTPFYSADLATGATVLLGTRDDFIRDIAIAPVPEPSSLALLGCTLVAGCAIFRCRKKTNL